MTADSFEVDTAQDHFLFDAGAVHVPNVIKWDPGKSILTLKNESLCRRAVVISGESGSGKSIFACTTFGNLLIVYFISLP